MAEDALSEAFHAACANGRLKGLAADAPKRGCWLWPGAG